MRIFAAFIAESQTDFIDGFFVGKKISDMKDNRGNKMKDYILRQRLAEYDAKLDLVYRNFSEYVHLAEKAFYSSVTTSSSEQYAMMSTPPGDLKKVGDVEYMSTPHLQKEISQKRQQPRSITEQEKLGYAQDCVNAFSNNEELSRQRAIEADLITKQRAQLGKKVIKERKSKVSELSGKPLDGMAEVHHKDRVADKPERAFDPTNLAVIRKDEHSEYHNSDYPQNEKGYEQFEKKYKK